MPNERRLCGRSSSRKDAQSWSAPSPNLQNLNKSNITGGIILPAVNSNFIELMTILVKPPPCSFERVSFKDSYSLEAFCLGQEGLKNIVVDLFLCQHRKFQTLKSIPTCAAQFL